MSEQRASDGPWVVALDSASDLVAAFEQVRARSLALTEVLEIEDYGVQPMADASPPKWHLAHTSWFFETFLLKPFLADWQPFDPAFEYLFNSYYNAVGEQFPRLRRGHLSRPTVAEVLAYRAAVDAGMTRLLAESGSSAPDVQARTVLGLHHEEQHQELLLTDIKYAFGQQPLRPVHEGARTMPAGEPTALTFSRFEGGLVEIGSALPGAADGDRDRFVFDNETPVHQVWLTPFELADRCVTSGEFLAFMEDGGYERPELWLADGWAWLAGADAPRAPLYWRRDRHGAWQEYRLSGEQALDPHGPLTHVSFYEADAYARWRALDDAAVRLPREAEWEHAARCARADATPARGQRMGADGTFMESRLFHPVPDSVLAGAHGGPRALLGNQWEWTSGAYQPYPGYRPMAGALGEYNGKFMCNQLVLRGGSCATPVAHARVTYRNFFYPPDRWQFTGVRLARDV
ncbi:MAG TPA: ergothioneine biosynthesis protein EgtB [Pseudomonadales bacterium]|nr:ergothioneine biosynthesis protein EgtB [Pseudomonadales bacterium]